MKKLCTICTIGAVLATLAACGGSDNTAAAGATPDAFLDQVVRVVGTTSETTEAIDIDALVATAPETTEPVALN
jgi:ABC-type glycerol-3-phosphate transport system substrate-binding protein